jgi:hypothetical protein
VRILNEDNYSITTKSQMFNNAADMMMSGQDGRIMVVPVIR